MNQGPTAVMCVHLAPYFLSDFVESIDFMDHQGLKHFPRQDLAAHTDRVAQGNLVVFG